MKNIDLNSVINPLAMRAGLISLRGHKIALPGVSSLEPLMRGCNQREWLERLVLAGIRHLVVPLNGRDEDGCLYARRHPQSTTMPLAQGGEPPKSNASVLYDLKSRDEGFFARLQFLLDTADSLGVMIGLSLFNATASPLPGGPFGTGANIQGLTLVQSGGARQKQFNEKSLPHGLEPMEEILYTALNWIAAEARGRPGVWMEIFRGDAGLDSSIQALEQKLTRRLATVLARPAQSGKKPQAGPWIVSSPGANWHGMNLNLAAPFDIWRGKEPEYNDLFTLSREIIEHDSGASPNSLFSSPPVPWRRPALYHFPDPDGRRHGSFPLPDRAELWRAVMHGCWPIFPGGFAQRSGKRHWQTMTQIANFANCWAGSGYLRSCPETLARMPSEWIANTQATAATDGCGRYFVYFNPLANNGLDLVTLPGSYRFFWIDPVSGLGLDRGEGLNGGSRCGVPGLGASREALLILEQEDLPDPMSVW